MAHRNHDEILWALQRLRRSRAEGRLVFVLGSGINAAYRLPDWSSLLIGLLVESGRLRGLRGNAPALRAILADIIPDPLLQGAIARKAYSDSSERLEQLKKALKPAYSPADADKPLAHIARIAARQYLDNRQRHIAILTFNYDELLEDALRLALGRRASALHSVARQDTFARSIHSAGVYVYHLHGSINDPASDIILDAASYVRILGSPGRHWSWDCMNLYLFQQDSAAMFLGLSLVDPSLRLLLSQSAEKSMTLSGLYVSKPFPDVGIRDLEHARGMAHVTRDLLNLFDEVLIDLSLTPYHVTEWKEVVTLLEIVAND